MQWLLAITLEEGPQVFQIGEQVRNPAVCFAANSSGGLWLDVVGSLVPSLRQISMQPQEDLSTWAKQTSGCMCCCLKVEFAGLAERETKRTTRLRFQGAPYFNAYPSLTFRFESVEV